MRTMRAGVMVAVALALVGAWTTAASTDDLLGPAYFTFTIGSATEFTEGEVIPIDDTMREIRGGSEVVPLEATDPRASGLMTSTHNADAFTSDDSHYVIFTTSDRLVNDGGAWSGTGTSTSAFTSEMALGDGLPRSTGLAVLTGEGGYEGLTLMLHTSYDGDSQAHWGVIVPTERMPPEPDAIQQPPDE